MCGLTDASVSGCAPARRDMTAHPFVVLVRAPAARWLALGGLVGRLREAGTGLAIVFAVRHVGGSFAAAGLATAAYLAGAAVSRPLHGRWVDRRGPGRALLVPSSANALGLIGLAVAAGDRAGVLVLDGLAVVIGVTLPALSAAMRATWPRVMGATTGMTDRAYAFDTLLYELSLIASPAIVACVAVLASPSVALVGLAVAGALGAWVVARACRTGRGAPPVTGRSAAGLLRSAILLGLIASSLFVGLAEGSLTVIVPAYAARHHVIAASGPLLAALSLGSLIGALAYGSLLVALRWALRLVICAAALTAACVALAALPAGVLALGVLLALVGLALSPMLTTGFVALQREAPAAALTEVFTWASFCAAAGAAGGQALAGELIAGPGVSTALWEPAAGAAAALVIAAGLHRHAQARDATDDPTSRGRAINYAKSNA